MRKNVSVLLFENVEALDFCGPLEVFSLVGETSNNLLYKVTTVAENLDPIRTNNGLSVNPDYSFINYPEPNILVVPGGFGARRAMLDPMLTSFIKTCAQKAEIILSVCTGSLILGACGLLDGKKATTHFSTFDLLKEISPNAKVMPGKRYVDNGQIITAAGVSAGIDAALYVVQKLWGKKIAQETADYMEYEYFSAR